MHADGCVAVGRLCGAGVVAGVVLLLLSVVPSLSLPPCRLVVRLAPSPFDEAKVESCPAERQRRSEGATHNDQPAVRPTDNGPHRRVTVRAARSPLAVLLGSLGVRVRRSLCCSL
jgi:hypothetical protein